MKNILPVMVTIGAIVCGCASSNRLTTQDADPGALIIEVSPSGEALDGVRVYVDGRFVGNHVPDGILRLPPGAHIVRVEIPRVYESYRRADGSGTGRTFRVRGEEQIEVLGGDSRQMLKFNQANLKKTEIDD